jgi:hypothetical protein
MNFFLVLEGSGVKFSGFCRISREGATMEMRMKTLLPVVTLVGALNLSNAASAQQPGTADDAKALLAKAVIAVKAVEAGALARFDNPNGGYKDRDLYVFCFDRRSGVLLSGQPTTKGKDVRTLVDPTGKRFGQEMFANVKDDDVIVVDYLFPKPNSTVPVAKESFVEGLADVACGVGYYNASTSAQAPGGLSRMEREQHACAVVKGLAPPGALYSTCIRTLDKTLSELDQALQTSRTRNFCARAGLEPGTPSFAACVETGLGS